MTGANSGVTSNGGGDASTSHCKGHRRQESMYAMTGLYSESVPEDNDGTADTKCSTTFCHDTVIKCHSRNPSAGFDRDKAAHATTYSDPPPVILRDTKECGILKCRPSFIQKYAGIKVQNVTLRLAVANVSLFSVLFFFYHSLLLCNKR
jgi:organic anion transporter 3A